MAKLSSYRRLYDQDFEPQYKRLVTTLGTTMNASFDELYSALNNKLTFKDNISCTIATFTVTVNSFGVPSVKTQFKLEANQANVEGLMVLDTYGAKDPTILPVAGVFVSFARNDSNIIIQNIKGLQPDTPYKVKVLVIG
jgi:hypothetical protein